MITSARWEIPLPLRRAFTALENKGNIIMVGGLGVGASHFELLNNVTLIEPTSGFHKELPALPFSTFAPAAGILGDEYSITGNDSGVNRKGESFEVNITEPLYKKIQMGCARTFTQGVLDIINVSNQEKIKLDYDPYNNNACDLIAKATIRSKEFIFTVR
jgi:hypothetical protein